jgi:hypothetical protein
MSLLGGDFSNRPLEYFQNGDMVDNDFGVVFLTPLFDIRVFEPLVKRGNKVRPLENLELLLGCKNIAFPLSQP